MPERILTGLELPTMDLDSGNRAMSDMYMMESGAVPKIQPEVPQKVEIKDPEMSK